MGGFTRVLLNGPRWETAEYAFWVVIKVSDQQVKFHYSTPQTDGSPHGVKLLWPVGYIVRAFCHTHPRSLSTGNFSAGDRDQFVELKALKSVEVPYYLMTPQKQLRLAETEKEFTVGKSIEWREVEP